MKKYVNNIETWGAILFVIAFCITTLWGPDHSFFPMIAAVLLLVVSAVYKLVNWGDYVKDNKRNLVILAFVAGYLFMYTVFGL